MKSFIMCTRSDGGPSLSMWVVCCLVTVLTWVIHCLSVNTDVQDAARQEVRQVCSEASDVSSADVDKMT